MVKIFGEFFSQSTILILGVGGTVHILGDGFKSMASPFFYQDIGINELNPKFY